MRTDHASGNRGVEIRRKILLRSPPNHERRVNGCHKLLKSYGTGNFRIAYVPCHFQPFSLSFGPILNLTFKCEFLRTLIVLFYGTHSLTGILPRGNSLYATHY